MNSTAIANFRSRNYEANLVVDTAIYASGDLLSDRVAITLDAAAVAAGKPVSGTITGITVLDKDDEGALMDLVILDADVSLGTINAAPSISDTNAQQVVAIVPVSSFYDLGGNRIGRPIFDPIDFESASGKLYIGAINGTGTPTYSTASDVRVKLLIALHNVNK